jgi:preprotein translocase subunit SecD
LSEEQPAVNGISNWGEAALSSVAAALALFLAAVPRVIGFLLILIIGWFIAILIARLVAGLLWRVNSPRQ